MFDYGFRDLYRDGFDALHLTLYQLDKLIHVLFFLILVVILFANSSN